MDERRGCAAASADASSHSQRLTASAPPNTIARWPGMVGDTAREIAALPLTAAVHHSAIACTTHAAPTSRSNSWRLCKPPCLHHCFEEGMQVVDALGGHKNGPKFVTGNPNKFRVSGRKQNVKICMLRLQFIVRTRTKGGKFGKILQQEWPQKRPFLTAAHTQAAVHEKQQQAQC